MKRWLSFALVLGATLLSATPARAIDTSEVMDGLRDKGFDALKDKAKDAGEEWVFGTGQSETMQAIIEAARAASNDSHLGDNGGCRGLVQDQASTVLNNLGMKNTAKNVGRVAFDTLTKVGSLAAGGMGAAAEGGGLAWLAKQYADAAKDAATDAAKEAIKKAFGKEKTPEFEVYEQSGTVGSGPCTYTLRALWDIVGGNYYVYISGDCGCDQNIRNGVATSEVPIGEWWISFTGSMLLQIDKEAKTAKFVPETPPTVDFDAQCACTKHSARKKLRRAVFKKVVKTPGPTTGTTGGGTTGGGTTGGGTTGGGTTIPPPPPPPPPIPPKGRKVCDACQSIQDQIDTDSDALDAASSEVTDADNEVTGLQNRLRADTDKLAAVKASPKSYDISADRVQGRIDADNADIATAKAKGAKAAAEVARLKSELRDLGVKLDGCIKKCGHASSHHKHNNALINFGLQKALDKHDKKDDQDQEEERRREEEQNATHNDDPYH